MRSSSLRIVTRLERKSLLTVATRMISYVHLIHTVAMTARFQFELCPIDGISATVGTQLPSDLIPAQQYLRTATEVPCVGRTVTVKVLVVPTPRPVVGIGGVARQIVCQ